MPSSHIWVSNALRSYGDVHFWGSSCPGIWDLFLPGKASGPLSGCKVHQRKIMFGRSAEASRPKIQPSRAPQDPRSSLSAPTKIQDPAFQTPPRSKIQSASRSKIPDPRSAPGAYRLQLEPTTRLQLLYGGLWRGSRACKVLYSKLKADAA